MTAIASNYVSPEALTLWLSEKQNEVYGDMRSAIDMSNERSEMQNELSTIKQHLQEAEASGDYKLVSKEIASFLGTHTNSPDFDQVAGPLVEINSAIIGAYAVHLASDDALTLNDALTGRSESVTEFTREDIQAQINGYDTVLGADPEGLEAPLQYGADQLKSWTDAIDSKMNFLSQQDQLAMIQIQELNGKVNQSEQLVSNLLASQNQTQNAVISNIRG